MARQLVDAPTGLAIYLNEFCFSTMLVSRRVRAVALAFSARDDIFAGTDARAAGRKARALGFRRISDGFATSQNARLAY